jgi:fructose-bisphosphate aldolase class 1
LLACSEVVVDVLELVVPVVEPEVLVDVVELDSVTFDEYLRVTLVTLTRRYFRVEDEGGESVR